MTDKTLIACTMIIALGIQWHAHYGKGKVSFLADILPSLAIAAYLGYRFTQ